MSVTVSESTGNTTTTDGTEQSLFTKEAAGVFLVRLDINAIPAGTILEIREKISVRAASTQRMLEGSPMTYQGGLAPAAIELPHRSVFANCTYEVTIKKVSGTNFDVIWSLIEVG